MKSEIIACALMCLFYVNLFAQQKSDSTDKAENISKTVLANWKKGQVKEYLITHKKESFENGKPIKTSVTYSMVIKVINVTMDGYTLQCNYTMPSSIGSLTERKALNDFYKGLNIIVKTTNTGAFSDLVNWKEVRDRSLKMVEDLTPKKSNGSSDSAMEKTKQLFGSKQMVINAMTKEIVLLLQVYGNTYTTKGTVINSELPNPFSPVKPIPALMSMRLFLHATSPNIYDILLTQNIDKDAASHLFEDIFDKMDLNEKDSSSIAEAKKFLSNFEIIDTCQYRINNSTGWATYIFFDRSAIGGEESQKDAFIIYEK